MAGSTIIQVVLCARDEASGTPDKAASGLTAAFAAFKGARVNANQLQHALTEVSIKVKQFSSINSGSALDFFQIMKADSKEFAKLSPFDQMLKIADVMKDMSADDKKTFLDQIGSDSLRETCCQF